MAEPSTHEPKTEREEKVAEHARAKALRDKKAGFVTKQATGFMNFIREQGVVGLAVGLSIGTAATVLVKSIVDSMINPIIGAFLPGGASLSNKFVCLTTKNGVCINKFAWGAVVSNLISFIAVAAMIYFVVKGLKLDRLDKKKDA